MRSMKIGDIEINGAMLAPMAGFTDVGFRDVCALFGAGVTYTEMVSAKGMVYGNGKTRELLAVTENERIKAVQIFGSDPSIMADAAARSELYKFDIIDINMGCPVPKIVKNGEGSALLKSPELAYKIVEAVVNAVEKPVTVKMRIGIKEGEFTAIPLAQAVESAGAAAITVHGRTREQYYSGRADWDAVGKIKQSVKIPVIANGDVFSADDYNRILSVTGADGVMIGRGALGRPQIFADIAPENCLMPKCTDIRTVILKQIETLKRFYSDRYIYSDMKKHVCFYAKGLNGVRQIRDAVCRVESVEEMCEIVNRIDWERRQND